VIIRDKRVLGNDSLDMIVLQNFLASADSRIEPTSDFVQVRGNVVLQNGRSPDPVRAITPGADIVYIGNRHGKLLQLSGRQRTLPRVQVCAPKPVWSWVIQSDESGSRAMTPGQRRRPSAIDNGVVRALLDTGCVLWTADTSLNVATTSVWAGHWLGRAPRRNRTGDPILTMDVLCRLS
jgi:hypothetical protein